MKLSSIHKLTFAVVFTLMNLLAVLWTVYSGYGLDAYGNRIATVRSLQHNAEPLWPQIEKAFKSAVPPDATPLPHGDVQACLAGMLRSPVVAKAFFVDNDQLLTVKQRVGPRIETYRVDLRSWRPTTLNLSPDRFRHGRLKRREEFIYHLIQSERFSWNEEIGRFLPIRPESPDFILFSKGSRHQGYLGYELDDDSFTERYGQPLLARYGLADDLHWTFLNWGEASLSPAEPVAPALRYLRLQVHSAPLSERNLRAFYMFFYLLAGELIACILGISACLRQGRAVLNERAIALAQSNFVSAVSHEMRTPLTTIKMYAEMIEQGIVEAPEKRAEYLRTISQECDRLTRLIENVLDYAKISGKRREYRFEEVSVKPLLDEAVAAMRGPLERAGIEVEVTAPPLLKATLDRDAVLQAIINLLSNAVKYAPDQKRIVLSAREEGEQLCLSVRDFGPGIPPREQRKIFKPFYRIGNELTRAAEGSGLGLALVQTYMKAHRGKVELESKQGEGATFRLVLPKRRKAA